MEQEKNNEITFNLFDIFTVFINKIWVLITLAVIGAIVAFLSVLITTDQTYKATARVYINNSSISLSSTITVSDLNASSSLVPTYSNLVKARTNMLEKVLEFGGWDYTYEELKSMITCTEIKDTAFLDISVTSLDSQEAMDIANMIVQVLPSKVQETIDGSSVAVVDRATKASSVSRGFTKKVLLGFIAGFAVAAIYIFVVYIVLNDTLESDDWIKKTYPNIPLLATIPDLDPERNEKHRYGYNSYYRKHYYKNYYVKKDK